jgi:hypothetical protein
MQLMCFLLRILELVGGEPCALFLKIFNKKEWGIQLLAHIHAACNFI